MAIVSGANVASLARVIAERWVKPEHLSASVNVQAVTLMAAMISVQWPLSLYAAGLAGIQKQVKLNAINGALTAARGIGAVVVLSTITSSIVAFLTWVVLITLANTLLMAA